MQHFGLISGKRFVNQFLHRSIGRKRHLVVTSNNHALLCVDIHTFPALDGYHLKRAETFHLHLLVGIQARMKHREGSRQKPLSFFLGESVTLGKALCNNL